MKKYSFNDHPEHKEKLAEFRDKWIGIVLRVEPQNENDRETCRIAMRGLYAAANLEVPEPTREIFVSSPLVGAVASAIAAGVWWLKENQQKHKELFGRSLSEKEIEMAIAPTCVIAICNAFGYKIPMPIKSTAATRAATRDATEAATRDATEDATWAATEAATWAAAEAATWDATRDATRDATWAATWAATSAATEDATSAATSAATRAATRDATWAATIVNPIVNFLLGCIKSWQNMYDGGNQWGGYCSCESFFRDVAKLNIDFTKYNHYEKAAEHGGPRFVHKKFWIICDFPERICKDEQNRPHSATGPSISWRDGFAAYYWRGTAIPKEWILSPKTIDPQLALNHPNIEQRRCVAEILGWDKVLLQLNAVVIDKDEDPMIGELVEVDLPDIGKERFLRVVCGTGRKFAIPVPPDMTSAVLAQAWIHGVDVKTIMGIEIRT